MSEAETSLTLYNLPGDIYDHLSDFLDDQSLFVLLTLSPRHITVANYLLQQRKWRKNPMEHWAEVGDLKGLQFLHRQLKIKCKPNAMAKASRNGHLDVVKYLHSIGAPWYPQSIIWASSHGHLAVVKFLHNVVKMPCPSEAMDWASSNGHLAVVKFLHEIGVPIGTIALDHASAYGFLDVVKFLHEIGAPYTTEAIDYACAFGYLDVIKFLHNIGAKCTTLAIENACQCGHMDVVDFLKSHAEMVTNA